MIFDSNFVYNNNLTNSCIINLSGTTGADGSDGTMSLRITICGRNINVIHNNNKLNLNFETNSTKTIEILNYCYGNAVSLMVVINECFIDCSSILKLI